MKQCIAYVPVRTSFNGWVRCGRRATRCSAFCRGHDDAVCGTVLGLLLSDLPMRSAEFVAKEAPPKAETSCRKSSKKNLESRPSA